MTLILKNLTTGSETVITDSTSLEQAILSVKDYCTSYSNTADDAKLTLAKSYADSLSAKLASDLALVIPDVNAVMPDAIDFSLGKRTFDATKDTTNAIEDIYIAKIYQNVLVINKTTNSVSYYQDQTSYLAGTALDSTSFILGVELPKTNKNYLSGIKINYADATTYKVEMTLILTIRDESYINAIGVAAKVYALKLVTDMSATFNQLVLDTATNTKKDANLYTDIKIQAKDVELKKYINTADTNVGATSKKFTQDEITRVENLIKELEAKGFTFDTFLEWLNKTGDYLYPKHLSPTIDMMGKILRFHFSKEKDVEMEVHNISEITDQVPTSAAISLKDIKRNGMHFKYVAHDVIENSYFGLYSIRSNVVDTEPIIKIFYKTGAVQFNKEVGFEVGGMSCKNVYKDVGSYSNIWTGWDTANFVMEEIQRQLKEYRLIP